MQDDKTDEGKKYYTYLIKNLINKKFYAGYTDNPKKRWREHINKAKRPGNDKQPIHHAIKKYGEKSFSFIVLKNYQTSEQALLAEANLIKHYGYWGAIIYNLTDGGEGTVGREYTEQQRQRTIQTKIKNGSCKFTMEKANEIRDLYKTGNYSCRKLGLMFNTGATHIARIINNREWKIDAIEKPKISRKLKLTDEENFEIIKVYNEGKYKQKEIEKQFNLYTGYIRELLQGRLSPNLNHLINKNILKQNAKLTKEEKLEIIRLRKNRILSTKEIGKLFNIKPGYVNVIYSIYKKELGLKGFREYKLTKEQIIEVITLFKVEKYSNKDLAKKFNVSLKTIQNIISGKSHKEFQYLRDELSTK